MIQGSSGGMNSGITGIYTYQVAATTGTVLNLSVQRSWTAFHSNHKQRHLPINTTTRTKCKSLSGAAWATTTNMRRTSSGFVTRNQELAVTQLYTNVLQQQIVPSGDKALDMTKPYMPVTYGGRPLNISYKAKQGRLDAVCPETWGNHRNSRAKFCTTLAMV